MIKIADDCMQSSAIEKIGEFRMKNGIRTLRQEQNIALWSKQVEECNSSGLTVTIDLRVQNVLAGRFFMALLDGYQCSIYGF